MNKRKQAEKRILELVDALDSSGRNTKRYLAMFKSMSDGKFDTYMKGLRDGKTKLNVQLPNLDDGMTIDKSFALARKFKVDIFKRIMFSDPKTGRRYPSEYKHMVLTLPIRRLSQYLFHKISLPESDKNINPISGQVIPPDKGAALSSIEVQILAAKGLENSVVELVKVRGGDVNAYNSLKYKIESSGNASMSDVDMAGRPRSVLTLNRYLHGIGIESTL